MRLLNLICVCFYIFALGIPSISEAKNLHDEGRKSAIEQYLLEVIRMNRFDKLKEYLDENPDVINRQFRGSTILAASAYWGRLLMVDLMLGLGADPNLAADTEKSPLMNAASGMSNISAIKGSSKELHVENLRTYIRVIHALINGGAEYRISYLQMDGPFDVHVSEDIINNLFRGGIFTQEVSEDVRRLALALDSAELNRIRKIVYLRHGLAAGYLRENCFDLFDVRLL